jgi:uncharacterized protein (DUF58 family)
MIAPTNRLLILYALTLPPLTLIPSLTGAAVAPAIAAGILLILIALLDAAAAPLRLRNIEVGLPPTVRMIKNREGSLEISLTNAKMKSVRLRLGVPFPREFASPQDSVVALLPKGAESFRLLCPCTPLKRGQFHIDRCYLEAKSPLGLWAFRSPGKVDCTVRVYPSLAGERRSLAGLFLNRGGFGIHARRQHGKGRDFEKLREYIPGDGFDEIHWKATAKRRHPITKVFQIERTQEVYVVLDASRLSGRPGVGQGNAAAGEPLHGSESCLEGFIEAALVVGLAAQKQGDLFGVVTFSDFVHAFLRARGGKSHYSACRERIFDLHPRMVNPDYDEIAAFIRLKLRRRALIMILTSLDDPLLAESFTRSVQLISHQHLVLVGMLRPAGARPLFSNVKIRSPQEIYEELSGHTLWHNLRELERTLARDGVHLALLNQGRLGVDLVSQYMNVKQRQLL